MKRIYFHKWIQWQLFEQFSRVRSYGAKKKVLFMGDLPFLTSRNSADVWAHPNYFKLHLSSGAPPDALFANGQRWGTPPCNWEVMEAHGYDYLTERLKFAEHFYDLIRIDHVVGLFRLWSIPVTSPLERGGLDGFFDPEDQNRWEANGRKLLAQFLNSCLLACAEDLGTVPECSFKVLEEFGIPGIDVQRWMRDVKADSTFKPAEAYRPAAVSVISTHDMASFNAWWEYEAGTVYGPLFKRQCEAEGISFEAIKDALFEVSQSQYDRLRWKQNVRELSDFLRIVGRSAEQIPHLAETYALSYDEKKKFWNYLGFKGPVPQRSNSKLAERALQKAGESRSIFNIQLLQDLLAAADLFTEDAWNVRINFPGIVNDQNWSLVMPLSLEALNKSSVSQKIKQMNLNAKRV